MLEKHYPIYTRTCTVKCPHWVLNRLILRIPEKFFLRESITFLKIGSKIYMQPLV